MSGPQQYATAIMDELRSWVCTWLQGVRSEWTMHTSLNLPAPYPNYPLPSGFPFGDFSMSQTFEWIHEYGAEQIRHSYPADFRFHGRTYGRSSSVAWKVSTTNEVVLGVFEIAGPVYDDPCLPFEIGPDLVFEAMLASLATHKPVHLGSHIGVVVLQNHNNANTAQSVQFFELRTSDHSLIRRVGARWVAQ
ncbi:hypothetical protein B0H10DRAFT_1959412 [Mycena sp. CBHHK59/15]|nr:hypothetical protein B0H10DRAFT_1959412 [Mycena sp. CBHHK59/15]